MKNFNPEPLEIMRPRLTEALRDLLVSGEDERAVELCHVFDFVSGNRLHIGRELFDIVQLVYVIARTEGS